MKEIYDDRIEIWYDMAKLYEKVADKSHYYTKFMPQKSDEPDNVLTYSLSEDERAWGEDKLYEAFAMLRTMVQSNSFDANLPSVDKGHLRLLISSKIFDSESCIDINCVEVLDSLFEIYIVNYLLLQWSNMICSDRNVSYFSQQNVIMIDMIARQLMKFMVFKPMVSYTVN